MLNTRGMTLRLAGAIAGLGVLTGTALADGLKDKK